MSAQATFWAWEQECTGNNKLVLLCLCDYANDTKTAWPSKVTIAKNCGISQSTVKTCVKNLIDQGLISEQGFTNYGNGKDCKKYKINIKKAKKDPVENEPRQNLTPSDLDLTPSESDPKPTNKHKPTIKDNKQEIEIPQGINFISFSEWLAYRKEKKKPVSQSAAAKQFKLLLKYSEEIQDQMISDSIMNDYQGLFEPKKVNYEKRNSNNPGNEDRSAAGRVRAKVQERQQQRQQNRNAMANDGQHVRP